MAQSKPTLSTDAGPQYEQAEREALDVLRRAADAWAKGDPEDPETALVLRRVLEPFLRRRFMRRPF